MKINLLAALVAVLFGVSYAAAANPADPISLMETDLGQATAELTAAGETPISFTGCGGCGSSKGWTAGVEATYLTPDFEANTEDFDAGIGTVDFDYDFEAAPRVWVGVENCDGLGVRARYWDYDAEASFVDIAFDTDVDSADGVFATSLLEMYTIDLEGTKRFCKGSWDMMASFGVRHAQIGNDFAGTQVDFEDDSTDADVSIALVSRQFDGTGVTFALEGSRPYKCSGLSLYWNARGSVLWGDNKAAAAESDLDGDNDGTDDVDTDVDFQRERDTLFIGEVQVGAEWKRQVKCLKADVFVRGVFEAQGWWLGNHDPVDTGSSGADFLGQGDLVLYGAAFSAGISR